MGTGTKREREPDTHDPGMNPAACSCFALIYDHLRQPIPAPCIVARTAAANSSRCAVPQQAPQPAGNFACDCMFWGERGGGYTRQPVGPSVDAAIMTTVLSTNRVDSRSFSSRSCAFRRTHTSTDPIRLLCIRLALPLTLFPCPHDSRTAQNSWLVFHLGPNGLRGLFA